MKRILIIVAVAAAVGIGLFQWFGPTGTAASAAYATGTAERGSLETVVAAVGAVEPQQSVEVGPQVSGQITALHVAEGDVVEAGQLLAEIDTRVYEASVEADRADLCALAAQCAQREAELTLARQQLGRQEQLVASRATSQDSYDSAVASVAVIEAQLAALDAEIAKRTAEVVLALSRQALGLVETQARVGTASQLEVSQQRLAVANLESAIPSLQLQRDQTRNALAARLGTTAGSVAVTTPSLDDITLPTVSAGLPSALLERRPDLRSAEAIAIESYRAAVLAAFRDVEDALAAIRYNAELAEIGDRAVADARSAYNLAAAQYQAGATDFIALLDAQRALASRLDEQRQIRFDRLAAAVDLYRSLGGGW